MSSCEQRRVLNDEYPRLLSFFEGYPGAYSLCDLLIPACRNGVLPCERANENDVCCSTCPRRRVSWQTLKSVIGHGGESIRRKNHVFGGQEGHNKTGCHRLIQGLAEAGWTTLPLSTLVRPDAQSCSQTLAAGSL